MEKNYYLYFDSPVFYSNSNKFYIQGSSPRILQQLISFLKDRVQKIDTIYMCMYLYNNPILDEELHSLAKNGCKIKIVSIPIEGYDATAKPQDLYDLYDTGKIVIKNQTKYSLAKKIYDNIRSTKNSNFDLFIFPHLYIRSPKVRPFSRGNMPYSLHAKSFYIKYKDGSGVTGMTSSNLAARDMIKDEIMLLVEGDEAANKNAEIFFSDLIQNSFHVKLFDEQRDWLHYCMPVKNCGFYPGNIYTAPFYRDSQDRVEEYLMRLVASAKERILICAQHICAYNYSYNLEFKREGMGSGYVTKAGLLSEVLKKGREGLEVKCLSQTFVDGNGDSHGCRRPENTKAFSEFIREFETCKNSAYAANPYVHSKYMIIDDIAVVTTCNFTPTQFIYLEEVKISKFEKIPRVSYCGIHSEVGHFITIYDKNICEMLAENFNMVWNRKDTYHHGSILTNRLVKICPVCNSEMKKRNGRYGEFWACSAYPQCKHTENI